LEGFSLTATWTFCLRSFEMATIKKKVDLPPTGASNPDPITKEPGSHPIETGVGAALGGAAAGMAAGAAAGAVAGPVGAAVGGAVGIVAGAVGGGYGGKAVGEMIDPTTEDRWVNEYYNSADSSRPVSRSVDDYRAPYHYGLTSRRKYEGKRFEDVEPSLRSEWEGGKTANLNWDEAKPAIRHAYCRNIDTRDSK
jgi:hypothetical protein